jgi:Sec7-like guanine-nucleotide exchange factor
MGQTTTKETLPTLPDEMYITILSYLNAKDTMNFSLVSKSFHQIAMNNYLWTIFFKREHLDQIFKQKNVDFNLFNAYKKRWNEIRSLCEKSEKIEDVLDILKNSKIVDDSTGSMVHFIQQQKGLNPSLVSKILMKKSEGKFIYLEEFFNNIQFKNKDIVDELRRILDKSFIILPSQTSHAMPFLYQFSERYYQENCDETFGFRDEDDVWFLISSILLLNVSLHSKKLKTSERITKIQYRGMLGDCKFDESYLDSVYENVNKKEI